MLHFLWIVPLLLLIFFLTSPRFRGDIAEARVRRLLARGLERNLFTVFNDVVLPSGSGTTRIDHVVVSKFGIFVIESRYVRGRITGTEVQDRWTWRSMGRSGRFDNPVHGNRLQVEALQRLLDFPGRVFHPLVVLVGHREFTQRPPAVVIRPEALLATIRRHSGQLLSPEQANDAIRTIDRMRLRSASAGLLKPLNLLRLLLVAALLVGAYLAFREDISRIVAEFRHQAERNAAPEQFHPDGTPKSQQELWEDSLICAYSVDTNRCSCYDGDGSRIEIEFVRCRRLAERGSILKQ